MPDPVLERVHYAAKPFELDYVRYYSRTDGGSGMRKFKPIGIWYSAPVDEDGWEHWCRGEEFRLEQLEVRHVLELNFERIRVVRTMAEIDALTQEYGCDLLPEVEMTFKGFDWGRFMGDYGGIEIAPYQWSARMGATLADDERATLADDERYFWYYPWDCSAGCIWDLDAVTGWEVDDGV